MESPLPYHEVVVVGTDDVEHRYPMASAPAEDDGHNLRFVDRDGRQVLWEFGTWAGWTLTDTPR